MKLVLSLLFVSVAACGGSHAVRVDCDTRLVPINVPSAFNDDSAAEGSPE